MYKSAIFSKINKSSFLKNSFWLTTAQGINGIANLILVIYLARLFGPATYGQFAYSLSFVTLFATFFDFGLTIVVTREFAKDALQEEHFQALFFLKLIIGLMTVSLILGLSFVVTKDLLVRKIILMLGLYQLFFQALNLFYGTFRARQRMEFEAFIRFFQVISLMSFVLLMVWYNHSILAISSAYAIATLCTLVITIIYATFFLNPPLLASRFKVNFSVCKKFLLVGWYLALAQGVGDIMINTDSFLLGYWGMLKGVGLYYAASKINAVVLFPMSIISTAMLPILISALKKSNQEFMRYWSLWMKYTVIFALLAVFLVASESENIIKTVYTDTYLPAATTLKILMIMAIIVYINNLYFQALLIFDQQRRMFYALLLGSLLNVILNLCLIPKWGIEGSAIATVAGQLLTSLLYILIISRKTFINPISKDFIRTLSMASISGAFMWFSLSMIKEPIYISLLIGIVLYAVSFLILKNGSQKIIIRWMNYANR